MNQSNKAPDTFNKFFVGVAGEGVLIMRPPRGSITPDDALNLAAWLVVLSTTDMPRFIALLDAVQNS